MDRALAGGFTGEEPCPYLADRRWRNLVVTLEDDPEGTLYENLLNAGFRRTGLHAFRPACTACTECRSLRVDVDAYRPTRSHRRALSRNDDLEVGVGPPDYDEEKRELLERFLNERHPGPMSADPDATREAMFDTCVPSYEMTYRCEGRLIAVGIIDMTPNILSSLYFYFDPDESRRSLGICSMAREIELARERGRRWYHPGYFVAGCSAMEYKARFGPLEMLDDDLRWQHFEGVGA